jgi:hypothetical protein
MKKSKDTEEPRQEYWPGKFPPPAYRSKTFTKDVKDYASKGVWAKYFIRKEKGKWKKDFIYYS